MKQIIEHWFECWEKGHLDDLPITEDFVHHSPHAIIRGKKEYLQLVNANKEKFLGHRFIIHNLILEEKVACCRYRAMQSDFEMEVTEWYTFENNLISEIHAYFQTPDIVHESRNLKT